MQTTQVGPTEYLNQEDPTPSNEFDILDELNHNELFTEPTDTTETSNSIESRIIDVTTNPKNLNNDGDVVTEPGSQEENSSIKDIAPENKLNSQQTSSPQVISAQYHQKRDHRKELARVKQEFLNELTSNQITKNSFGSIEWLGYQLSNQYKEKQQDQLKEEKVYNKKIAKNHQKLRKVESMLNLSEPGQSAIAENHQEIQGEVLARTLSNTTFLPNL